MQIKYLNIHVIIASICTNILSEVPNWIEVVKKLNKPGDSIEVFYDENDFLYTSVKVELVKTKYRRTYRFLYNKRYMAGYILEGVSSPFCIKDSDIYWCDKDLRILFKCMNLIRPTLIRWDEANMLTYSPESKYRGKIRVYKDPKIEIFVEPVECGNYDVYRFCVKTNSSSRMEKSCNFQLIWKSRDDYD